MAKIMQSGIGAIGSIPNPITPPPPPPPVLTNIVTSHKTNLRAYIYDGLSSTVVTTITGMVGGGTIADFQGMEVDNDNNFVITSPGGQLVHRFVGLSNITDEQLSMSYLPRGITWDRTNDRLITADTDNSQVKIRTHNDFTNTISDTFTVSDREYQDIAIDDNDNLMGIDRIIDKIFLHNGITSSISSSFATPAGNGQGLTFDGTNIISMDGSTDKVYVHSGKTSTITDSFSQADSSGETVCMSF